MWLGNNTENEIFLFNNILMKNSNEQKILDVITNNMELQVYNYKWIKSELFQMVSQKIATLSRLSSYLHNSEKK